jgi:hypothetical protein
MMICAKTFLPYLSQRLASYFQLRLPSRRIASVSSRMAHTLPKLPVFEAIAKHDPHSIAVVHSASGRKFTYGALLRDVVEAKDRLHKEAGSCNIGGQRIAFLVENSYDYVGAQKLAKTLFKTSNDNHSNSTRYP